MKSLLARSAIVLSVAAGMAGMALAGPPVERGTFRAPDLVELIEIDPRFKLDIKYARTDNFMNLKMYPEARAFLQRPAALALKRAHEALRAKGYGLLIFDGYRPWRITKLMWDKAPPAWRSGGFVADPEGGSRHNRGCAVDLTLFDLKTGQEVKMPSSYDAFDARAYARHAGGSKESRVLRNLLIAEMEKQGFKVLPEEWWHFDYKDWRLYRIQDVDFSEL